MRSILNVIINYILPARCLSCSEFIESPQGFCFNCWKKLNLIAPPYCKKCGRMFSINVGNNILCGKCLNTVQYYDLVRSLFVYDQYSRKIIGDFKYHDKTSIAKTLAHMLFNRYKIEMQAVDYIAPVPMYKLKRLLRMYNQAQILGQELSQLLCKPILNNLLIKYKWTKPQTYLSQKLRLKNVANTIKINNKHIIEGKIILLVDDVITTGTTVNESSKILKKAGAKAVYVVSIASTSMDKTITKI